MCLFSLIFFEYKNVIVWKLNKLLQKLTYDTRVMLTLINTQKSKGQNERTSQTDVLSFVTTVTLTYKEDKF